MCAECGANDPSWVSINYGVVVCLDCSSIHKNLPENNVKSVRSLSVAYSDIVKKQEGNTKANTRYEKNIPLNLQKPNPKDNYEVKLAWIKAKYLNQNPSSDNLTSINVSSTNNSNIESPNLSSNDKENVVKLDSNSNSNISGRNTPLNIENNSNNNNERSLTPTPINDKNSRPITPNPNNNSDNSRPITPTPITDSTNKSEESIDPSGLNLKSGTDTSNGKGTWRSNNGHSAERKASFLDKPSRTPPKREHEGYLYKTSRPTSKDASDWKKYLFVFKDDVITYYKVSKKNKKKEKGIIDLFHSVKQEFDRPKQKYSFTLITSQRLYFLAAETEEEMKTWIEVLNGAMKP